MNTGLSLLSRLALSIHAGNTRNSYGTPRTQMVAITQRLVDSLNAREKRYTKSHDGLVVEVNPSGKKTYYASFREGGIRHKQKLGSDPVLSVAEAKAILVDLKHRKLVKGQKAVQSKLTFKEFAIDEHIDGNFRGWCIANRKDWSSSLKRINKQFIADSNPIGKARIKDVRADQIDAYKVQALKRNSPATVKRHLVDLKKIFSLALERELIHSNPTLSVKSPRVDRSPKKRRMLTGDERIRLFQTLNKWRSRGHMFSEDPNRRFYPSYLPAMILLALHLGLRKGEIMSLSFEDWDVRNRMIHIRGHKSKSGHSRQLSMTNIVEECVKHWMKQRMEDFTELVPSETKYHQGEPDFELVVRDHQKEDIFPIRDPKRTWKTFRKLADLEHIDFHTLRHDFASQLVLLHTPLSVIRDLMGHSDIQTTNIYLSALDTHKQDALQTHSEQLQKMAVEALEAQI